MLSMVGSCYKHPKAVREQQTTALQLGFSSIQNMTTTHHKAGTACPAREGPTSACALSCLTASSSKPSKSAANDQQHRLCSVVFLLLPSCCPSGLKQARIPTTALSCHVG